MTEQEKIKKAIKMLQDWNKDLALMEDEEEGIECHELAINALEKQIAKNIVRRKATDEDIETELRDFITTQGEICRCPTCKDCICVSGIEYCWNCGQRLNWSDEE